MDTKKPLIDEFEKTNKPIKASNPVEVEKTINPALKNLLQSDDKDY